MEQLSLMAVSHSVNIHHLKPKGEGLFTLCHTEGLYFKSLKCLCSYIFGQVGNKEVTKT